MPIDPSEIVVAQAAVRRYADASGYGGFISDDECRQIAIAVVQAVELERAKKVNP